MTATPHCPDCGGPLGDEGWGEELCPNCLMRLALVESSDDEANVHNATTDVTQDLTSQTLKQGQVLGNRYGIRSLLGRGGMGEVWRAFDLKLRVDVALKTVRADLLQNSRMMDALRREVRAAREVASPNVCRVFDLEELDGRELVSMEFVQGETLGEVLHTRGPLEIQEARETAAQLLAGLEAIHGAGLVHRDLKPDNVMITPASRVVVMDFGIAKGLAEASAGTVSGTPAYMAPEQARGEAVDARADVYSAGIVLTEMLAPKGDDEVSSRMALLQGIRSQPPQLPDSPWLSVLEQAVAQRPGNRFASAASLARSLEEVTIRVEGAEDVTPYPGLVAFGEHDREYFFGRELEVEHMWKKLRELHMLALIGPSGAGKTSFLRAGLLAAAPAGWSHVICTPGESPLTSLRQALVPELSGDSEAMRELVKVDDPKAVVTAVSRWRTRSKRAMLVVDQFEELFTLNPADVQAEFAELLGRLALDADVRVLLSLRDDFLVQCHAHEPLRPILSELTVLGPPAGAALRRAVVQPALKCGYRFEDEALVDEMLAEVQGERGALPMLAFAAEQLWERRDRDQGLLTRDAYEVIGGVGGALAQHAELTLERIGKDRVPVVRELFRNLVTAQGTRAVRDRDELLSVFGHSEHEASTGILDALIDARLLTSYGVEASDGAPRQRIEIVHESLLSAWPRLVRWMAQDVEGARLRDDLRQAARRWQERDRPDDLLWSGSAFREYQVWRERYPGRLSEIEEAFVRAMAEHATRRRRRRRVVVTAAFTGLAVVAVVLAVLLRHSMLQTLRAEASKLLALGHTALEVEHTEALAYAIAAVERTDTPDARRLALRALWAGPPATILPNESSAEWSLAFAPEGRFLAVSRWKDDPGLIRVYSKKGGPPVELRVADTVVTAAAFSADGRRLVAPGPDVPGELHIWETDSWQTERVIRVPGAAMAVGMVERGGETLITAGGFPLDPSQVSKDRQMRLVVHRWPLAGGAPELIGSAEGTALPFAFPDWDRGLLPVGRGDRVELHRFDTLGREPGRVIARHPEGFSAHSHAAFDPSAERAAFWDAAGNLCVWPLDGDGSRPERCIAAAQKAFGIAFSPDGSLLAQATYAQGAQVWDLRGPAGAEPLDLDLEGEAMLAVAFSTNGRWLATGRGKRVALWPMTSPYCRRLPGHEGGVSGIAFSADSSRLYSQGRIDGRILAWDLEGGAGREPAVVLEAGWEWGWGLAADPLGRFLISADVSGLRQVPLDGGEPTLLAEGPSLGTALGPSGRLLARQVKAGDGPDSTVEVRDLESGERWELDEPGEGGATYWHFDQAGRLLVARGGVLSRWDPTTGTSEILLDEDIAGVLPLPDGHRLFVSGRKRWIHDLDDGSRVDLPDAYQRTRPPRPLWFNADASVFIMGSPDGEIRVGGMFDEQPHHLLGGDATSSKYRVSPDGRWVAAASTGDTVLLWPVPDLSRKPLHTLPRDEFVAKLKALTNLRAVPDGDSFTGYSIEVDADAYRGWGDVPEW